MSKFFFFAAALCSPFINAAQTVVDFESFTFPAGQNFWNGSDESGAFTISGAAFSNNFNTDWSSWAGFSVSAEVDVTTAGWLNQYSAFAGSGANESEKFAVYYPHGEITFSVPTELVSIAVTNTTYAALAMRDGDDFAKQFGSIFNAAGEEDGTEGKDFFKLTIIGVDADDEVTGEVEFYLADYRSDDASEHYILDTWQTVDLAALGSVTKILFELESSDVADWGMWTPEYFALDDLKFNQTSSGIAQERMVNYEIYPNPAQNFVHIASSENVNFELNLLSASGSIISNSSNNFRHNLDLSDLTNGVYFLQMNSVHGSKTERVVIAR